MSTSTNQPPSPGGNRTPVFQGFIPRLKHLLQQRRGIPGIHYYQVCTHNLRLAQDRGLREVDNTLVYTITGPKGSVDVKLYCFGKPIPGQSHLSGRRRLFCDPDIEARTGLSIQPLAKEPMNDAAAEKSRPQGRGAGPQASEAGAAS